MTVRLFDKDGKPIITREELKAQAAYARAMGAEEDTNPHGLSAGQIDMLDQKGRRMLGSAYVSGQKVSRSIIDELMPEGTGYDPRRTAQMVPGVPSGNGSSMFGVQPVYQPEYSDETRTSYPTHRRTANTYWRMFKKLDPEIGMADELLSTLPYGEFQLTGEGVDGTIKETYETMIRECSLDLALQFMTSQWHIVGEAIPHNAWDNDKGIWTHIALHNPDQINVVDSHVIKMDPIMEFVPPRELQKFITSTHPQVSRVRETMPPELISHIRSGENIPLSPVNTSFIARKLDPYDSRGTSILSRLWRTFCLEDSSWRASLNMQRRAAAPRTIIKLGDPATGTIPSQNEERRVLSMFAQTESDPTGGFIVYNYQLSSELIGAPERILGIVQNHELIKKIKLTALGISESLLSGESAYSAAAAGLTVFLQRLLSIRNYFVRNWLIPKFFLPVAIMNEWVKPEKAESSQGHLRVKKSAKEMMDENLYIVPTVEWKKSLDPQIDQERIDAMTALEQNLGVRISDQKKYACLGLDNEEEQKQVVEEIKFKKDLAGEDPLLQVALGLVAGGEEGMGGAGGGMGGPPISPGIPGEAFGVGGEGAPPGGAGDMGGGGGGAPGGGMDMGAPGGGGAAPPPTPAGAAKEGDKDVKKPPKPADDDDGAAGDGQYWAKKTLQPLEAFFDSRDIQDLGEEPWVIMLKSNAFKKVLNDGVATVEADDLWDAIERWLMDEGYPAKAVIALQARLTKAGKLRRKAGMSDENFGKFVTELGINKDDFTKDLK